MSAETLLPASYVVQLWFILAASGSGRIPAMSAYRPIAVVAEYRAEQPLVATRRHSDSVTRLRPATRRNQRRQSSIALVVDLPSNSDLCDNRMSVWEYLVASITDDLLQRLFRMETDGNVL